MMMPYTYLDSYRHFQSGFHLLVSIQTFLNLIEVMTLGILEFRTATGFPFVSTVLQLTRELDKQEYTKPYNVKNNILNDGDLMCYSTEQIILQL